MTNDDRLNPPEPIPLPAEANVLPSEPPRGLPQSPPEYLFPEPARDDTYPPPESLTDPSVPPDEPMTTPDDPMEQPQGLPRRTF